MIERALAAGHEVSLFCLPPSSELGTSELFPIHTNLSWWKLRRKFAALIMGIGYPVLRTRSLREKLIEFAYGLESRARPFKGRHYDLVIVEDLFLLPYCLKHAKGTPVIFDAREFYPKQREGNLLFELFEHPIRNWACKTYLPLCRKVFTVSEGLSHAYKAYYGISTAVLRSTPPYREAKEATKQSDPNIIKIIHIGVANSNRKIENMIKVFQRLKPGFIFDIYLSGNKPYTRRLKRLTKKIEGVQILEPVSPNKIIDTLAKYDVSFCYFEPTTFNIKHCLPNKFFESIQARVTIAIGPSPDMVKIVEEYNCGFIAEKFSIDSMAKMLNAIDEVTIQEAKNGIEQAALELCAEKEWNQVDSCLSSLKSDTSQHTRHITGDIHTIGNE